MRIMSDHKKYKYLLIVLFIHGLLSSVYANEIDICIAAGGEWNECGSACMDACLDDQTNEVRLVEQACIDLCIPQCECELGQVFDGRECVTVALENCSLMEDTQEMNICRQGGGIWSNCTTSVDDCLEENGEIKRLNTADQRCMIGCECPPGESFNGEVCVMIDMIACEDNLAEDQVTTSTVMGESIAKDQALHLSVASAEAYTNLTQEITLTPPHTLQDHATSDFTQVDRYRRHHVKQNHSTQGCEQSQAHTTFYFTFILLGLYATLRRRRIPVAS